MQAFMPMLVVRTHMATAAVELNGTLIGEASPDEHLSIPLSDNGEYYIGIYPLKHTKLRYFPVVRKLSFSNGELAPVESEDVEVFAWPGGIFEAVLTPGVLPDPGEEIFPYTIDQIKLGERRFATLYYDNGLKLAVEEGMRVLYGTSLGESLTGRLVLQRNGLLIALAGEPNEEEFDAPEGYATTVVVLDSDINEILRISCDAVGIRNEEEIVCFSRLRTMRKHERKWIYRLREGEYDRPDAQIGFFLHSPKNPSAGEQTIHAFCDAIRYELWDEAMDYLSPSLSEGLNPVIVRECMGDFLGIRSPLTNKNSMMGLIYKAENGIIPVRVFSFKFDDELIDNISEE